MENDFGNFNVSSLEKNVGKRELIKLRYDGNGKQIVPEVCAVCNRKRREVNFSVKKFVLLGIFLKVIHLIYVKKISG